MSHPIIEKIIDGTAPPQVKKAAARGSLPVPREDLIEAWVCLRNDQDNEIRLDCKEALGGISEVEWIELLPRTEFREEVLTFALTVLGRNEKILQAALRNKAVPAEAVRQIASRATGTSLDQILDNQERLIASPAIVKALLDNPNIQVNQVRVIFDLTEQFFKDDIDIVSTLDGRFGLQIGAAGGLLRGREKSAPAKEAEESWEAKEELAEEAAEEQPAEREEEEEKEAEAEAEAEFPPELIDEDAEIEDGKQKTLYQEILTMPIPKKIELAMKGNKEARGLLIKDSNKTVQEAVLNSGRITEREVESFAMMKSLPDDIIRRIARDPRWRRNYTIRKNLIKNPKTPISVTMPMIKTLVDADLKVLQKDRGVGEVVRREAKKTFEARHKKKDPFKKF